MQKKTLWAGVAHGEIKFFNTDPNGNVEGLQGSRKFYVQDNKLTDDSGNNIVDNTQSGGGANSSDVAEQTTQSPQATA